jgi:hypothetical protein
MSAPGSLLPTNRAMTASFPHYMFGCFSSTSLHPRSDLSDPLGKSFPMNSLYLKLSWIARTSRTTNLHEFLAHSRHNHPPPPPSQQSPPTPSLTHTHKRHPRQTLSTSYSSTISSKVSAGGQTCTSTSTSTCTSPFTTPSLSLSPSKPPSHFGKRLETSSSFPSSFRR